MRIKPQANSLILIAIMACGLTTTTTTQAQIVPDASLPINSVVTPSGTTVVIGGGTRAGNNLFHSFNQFNILTGGTAFFNNSLDIQNIISRVTGHSVSQIDGILKTNGTANLFLLNPNGIIFSSGAQLNIGGSFLASTANAVKFADGTLYSATNPQSSPLLTISVPIGLQFAGATGSILNQSRATNSNGELIGLQVQPTQTLALVGGDVTLAGGLLTAPQGRIELGSVAGNGLVSLNSTGNSWTLGYNGVQNGNILLSQQAVVNASGPGGGNIQVQGNNVTLSQGSRIVADTLSSQSGGGINIQAQQLSLQDGAFVSASTFGVGAGGNLTVNASSIGITGTGAFQDVLNQLFFKQIQQPSQIGSGLFALSFGAGAAGTLKIATGTLSLTQGAFISTATFNVGRGGDMQVNASQSIELIGSELFADSFGNGNAGQVNVQTGKLTASEGGALAASTFGAGLGGTVNLIATDSIALIGTTPDGQFNSGLFANAYSNATQPAGNINVETRQLTIQDGAGIGAATFGVAQGGTVNIRASDLVKLVGVSGDGREQSSVTTRSQGQGDAGDIQITTQQLVVRDGATISTATSNAGLAGRLNVNASESVAVIGSSADGQFPSSLQSDASLTNPPSNLFLPTSPSGVVGAAGDLRIKTSQLIVKDGAKISVSAGGLGGAGDLQVQADSLLLNNGRISAETAAGDNGNITLDVSHIQLRHGSRISTNAQGTATGGNIIINTDTLVALENSDITANAQKGSGGRVTVNAKGIFGTQFRPTETPQSDITATSDLGPQFSGTVTIVTPTINPSQGLVNLPEKPVDVSGLVASDCSGRLQGSKFIVTGRGGLPPNPNEAISGEATWVDLRPRAVLESRGAREVREQNLSSPPSLRLVEAQGWVINAKGQVVLVAQAPTVVPHIPITQKQCYVP